jgi:ferredoxin--NADP+ reductase
VSDIAGKHKTVEQRVDFMLGLELGGGREITRAYSLASANHEDHLEFYSVNVANGALTSRREFIVSGSPLLGSAAVHGTLGAGRG